MNLTRRATVHFMDGPNVGHFIDDHFVRGTWAVVRFIDDVFKNWEAFNLEAEAIEAKDRWEKEGRI